MITELQARQTVEALINQPDPYWPTKPKMVITETKERTKGWLYFWTSKKYLDSQDINDAIGGNGPILVSKTTGKAIEVGSAPPIEERIKEAEKEMDER